MPHLTPAKYVVHLFGGVRKTARLVGRSEGSVGYWLKPKAKGGAGGRIPSQVHPVLLHLSKKYNLGLTPSDLICGHDLK